MATRSKKQLAPAPETTELATVDLSGYAHELGAGLEGTDAECFSIPFLRVLQALSPQCGRTSAAIAGAQPGMLINTVTNRLYNAEAEPVWFVPCAFQRRFLRWPEERNAGLRGVYTKDEVDRMVKSGEARLLDRRLRMAEEDGHVDHESDFLADTRSHFGLAISADGAVEEVLLSLGSTQIKKSRNLLLMLDQQRVPTGNGLKTLPTYACRVKLSTVPESNDEGEWFGVRFGELQVMAPTDPLVALGRAFHSRVVSGQATADFSTPVDDAEEF